MIQFFSRFSSHRPAALAGLLCLAATALPASGVAQGYFMPPAAKPAPAPAPGPRARTRPAPAPLPADDQSADDQQAGQQGGPDEGGQQDDQASLPQYNLPALAPLPSLPKTAPPPVASIGVLGVSDIMRASTAAQLVQKVVGARRDKLNQDAQREQAVWRDMQQALVAQRGTLSSDQLTAREKALQDRILSAQKVFRARNRVIQEAAQVSLAQVERVLVAVIRQVAESRNMNLVLHREQVALNISDFDITDQVTAQLNSILPSVTIPPDGQDPTPANTGGALVAAVPAAAAAPAGR